MLFHAHALVADDDPDVLDVVARGLTRLGMDVVRASTGAELIERLAHDGPFDLIVTDVNMPWMSGLEAIHATRAAGLRSAVIVMTALTNRRIPAMVEALGAKAVLMRKPFALEELQAAASKLLPDMSQTEAAPLQTG
jgi:two-component system response regulator MprA